MIPVVTFIGIDFGILVGSAILTETVFNWPGLGSEDRPGRQRPRPAGAGRPHVRGGARVRPRQPARRHQLRVVRPARPTRGEGRCSDASRSTRSTSSPASTDSGHRPAMLHPRRRPPVPTATSAWRLGSRSPSRPASRTASPRSSPGPLVPPGRVAPVRKNKLAMFGLVLVIFLLLVGRHRPVPGPGPAAPRSARSSDRSSPDATHWFGTDQVGRDVFARVVYGIRLSLFIGFTVTVLETFIGVSLGALAGLAGPARPTRFIMRVVDVLLGIPYLVLAFAFIAVIGRGRRRRDHHPGAHVLADHGTRRAGRVPAGQAVRVRRGGPGGRRAGGAASCGATSCPT